MSWAFSFFFSFRDGYEVLLGADVGCQGSPSIDITWIRTTSRFSLPERTN